ncbi:hypothetical protein [Leptospira tipperaryensis]|nr:hypothetical protein [Leptospira tipperaryensis]
MKTLRWIYCIFLILSSLFCIDPKKNDAEKNHSLFSDILVNKTNEKIRLEFTFYREISEILNGRENRGFGKAPLVVDFPKINGEPLIESQRQGLKIYSIEIENVERDYTISFMRKDGLYKGVIRIDPKEPQSLLRAEFRK